MKVNPVTFLELAHQAGSIDKILHLDTIDHNSLITRPPCTKSYCENNDFPAFFCNYIDSQMVERYARGAFFGEINILCWQWKKGDEKALKFAFGKETIFVHSIDPYWLQYYPVLHDIEALQLLARNDRHPKILNFKQCVFVGGDSNPSHFFGDIFPAWLAIIKSPILSKMPIVTFCLPGWQRMLLADIAPQLNIMEIGLESTTSVSPLLIRLEDCFVFEEIRQFSGWNITRSFFANYLAKCEIDSSTSYRRLYFSRRMYEINHGLPPRVVDSDYVQKLLKKHGFEIIYPENYSILNLQKLISNAMYIISDPGSCNIHALLSPAIAKGECTAAFMGVVNSRDGSRWDMIRQQELLGLPGDYFYTIYGDAVSPNSNGVIPSLYYSGVLAWIGQNGIAAV